MSDDDNKTEASITELQRIKEYMKEQRQKFKEEHPDQYKKMIEEMKNSQMSQRERWLYEEHAKLLGKKKH